MILYSNSIIRINTANPSPTRALDPFLTALLIVFALFALTYSIVIPLFEGPDEDDHFRYAKYLADHHALPVQRFEPGGGEAGHQGWQPPLYYALAALVIAPIDTRDYAQHLQRNPAQSFTGDITCCGRNLYFHFDSEDFPYQQTTLAVHLARGVTILFGVACVYAVYALTLTLFPGSRYLALATAALATLNPSFLFASALVSNDIPLVAFCTLALLVMAKIATRVWDANWKSFGVLGIVIACGLMVKTTALGLVPLALALIAYFPMRAQATLRGERHPGAARRDLGEVHRASQKPLFAITGEGRRYPNYLLWTCSFLFPILILAGWWFFRNQILYGDPLAYRLVSASALPPRDAPLTLAELTQINLPWLWQTFWGGPTPGDFPQALLALLLIAFGIAILGTVLHLARDWRALGTDRLAMLGLLMAWLAFIVIAQLQFIRTASGTDQGRYLFPAIAAIALVYGLGWSEIVWRVVARLRASFSFAHAQRGVAIFCTAFLVALPAFVLAAYTLPAYANPPPFEPAALDQRGALIEANFENGMQLRGYALASRALSCGDRLAVTLFWTSDAPMNESYRVFVHLVDAERKVAGNKDVIPGHGAYPTVYWKPGAWFQDTVFVPLNHGARDGSYNVIVGTYKFGEPDQRVNLRNSEEDFVTLADVRVSAPAGGCP